MNSKFYVSLEAARLLKEKGYRQTYHAYYFGNSNLRKGGYRGDSWYDSPDFYPAPTKAEAIDWLDERRLARIVIHYRPYSGEWYGEVISFNNWTSDITDDYKTRLEAEEAAIIKALELL